jgi:hypothetical protein
LDATPEPCDCACRHDVGYRRSCPWPRSKHPETGHWSSNWRAGCASSAPESPHSDAGKALDHSLKRAGARSRNSSTTGAVPVEQHRRARAEGCGGGPTCRSVHQLEREGSPPPGLRLPQAKLSRYLNQVARGRIRRFESCMPSQPVRFLPGVGEPTGRRLAREKTERAVQPSLM